MQYCHVSDHDKPLTLSVPDTMWSDPLSESRLTVVGRASANLLERQRWHMVRLASFMMQL